MFGFLIASEVNDDAVKLKTFAEMAYSKYSSLNEEDLKAAITRDFIEDKRYFDNNYITFRYPELREFQFVLRYPSKLGQPFSIFGEGKYSGFMLQINDGKWHCSVSDGIMRKATGGAKKLSQIMEKKFQVKNYDKLIKQLSSRSS